MAVSHVSGVIAMLYAVNPELTPEQMEQIIKNTARAFPNQCNGCGTGILDANAAIAQAGDDPGTPNLILLENGVPESNISGNLDDALLFAIDVPADVAELNIALSEGSGDSDLYVRFGAEPTLSHYDCRPYITGNQETCLIEEIQAGRYYVMLHGYTDFSNVTLVANYLLNSEMLSPITSFDNQTDYPIPNHDYSGVSSPITVGQAGDISGIEVEIDIEHPHISEIFVELLDPSGRSHTLKSFGGTDSVNLQESYKLNTFDEMAGTWKLRVRDFGVNGTGHIDSWRIIFY
jgi:serine protease